MKKAVAFWVAVVLLCLVSACAAGAGQPADTPSPSAAETEQPVVMPVDYTVFCGNYSDTETVEGPCYTVSILGVDNAAGAIELEISYVGINSSPVYVTELIRARIAEDHTAQFEWMDSWANRGIGTLVLDPDNPSQVQLMMAVTDEAEVNRATLSTGGQYKNLMRREA